MHFILIIFGFTCIGILPQIRPASAFWSVGVDAKDKHSYYNNDSYLHYHPENDYYLLRALRRTYLVHHCPIIGRELIAMQHCLILFVPCNSRFILG